MEWNFPISHTPCSAFTNCGVLRHHVATESRVRTAAAGVHSDSNRSRRGIPLRSSRRDPESQSRCFASNIGLVRITPCYQCILTLSDNSLLHVDRIKTSKLGAHLFFTASGFKKWNNRESENTGWRRCEDVPYAGYNLSHNKWECCFSKCKEVEHTIFPFQSVHVAARDPDIPNYRHQIGIRGLQQN